MRIISHAYPPPPLIMNNLHNDLSPHHDSPRVPCLHPSDPSAPRSGSPSHTNLNLLLNAISDAPNTAPNHTHDSSPNTARSPPYPNVSAPRLERPTSDPTAIRTLLSAPHPSQPPHHAVPTEWRAVGATDHRHNGEHMSVSGDARDGQVRRPHLTRETRSSDASLTPKLCVSPQASSSKRKLDEPAEESQSKIRRTVRDHVVMDYARVMTMTTVVCLHAAVAQKSYGSEKRFLCPPPVVRIETPFAELRTQQLSMCIVTENGERGSDQRSALDNNLVANFKYLHVAGTAKSKSFQLALDIGDPNLSPPTDQSPDSRPERVWASFDSAPVTIISKPSKKTAKTRNISSCILAGGPVSLFNRINSQTVRTKYMTIEHSQLCASNLSWSAFNVNVTRRHAEAGSAAGPQPVTYGSEIQLVDSLSGITTNPLIIRKVDKGKVSSEDGGPVSQMQKIALQRINADRSRSYLSAAGPVPGAPVPGVPTPLPGNVSQPASHPLLFQAPRVRDEVRDGIRFVTDEVDDYLCWTIVGISKFQYTFFDASGHNTPVPSIPITPFPTLFTAPAYRPAPHTLELTVSNFFYQDPETHALTPLEVWLGHLGPLRQRIFQATPPGPLTSVSPYAMPSGGPVAGEAVNIAEAGPSGNHRHSGDTPQTIVAPPRFIPSGPLHTIVIVDLPPMNDIVKSLQEGMISLAAGAAEAAHMMGPTSAPRSPSSEHGRNRGSEGTHEVATSDHPEAGPSSGPGQPILAEDARSRAHPSIPELEGVQGPMSVHSGPLPAQALPLLFIRGSDGIGYHSGRSIACDHLFHDMSVNAIHGRSPTDARSPVDGGWLSTTQNTVGADPGLQGWSLRVI